MTGAVAAFLQAKRMPIHGSERIFSGRRDLFFAAFAIQDLDVTARPMQLQESQDGAARLVFEVCLSKCCVIQSQHRGHREFGHAAGVDCSPRGVTEPRLASLNREYCNRSN